MDQHYEKLEELIKDEDKIVTVPSFAWETKLSQNDARSIIEKFIQNHEGPGYIQITYVLVGRKKGENQISVLLVQSKDLQGAKDLYQDEVEESVFSIQKAKTVDYNVIALVDSSKDILTDSIVGKNCIRRVLYKKVLPPIPTPTVKGKSSFFTKQNKEVKSEEKVTVKKENDTGETSKNKSNQQSSIANMFNKAAQNKKDFKSTDIKSNGLTNSGKKNSIMNLFAKEAQKNKVKKEIKAEPEEEKELKEEKIEVSKVDKVKVEKKSDLFDSDTDEDILKDLDMNEGRIAEKTLYPQNKSIQKKKTINNSKKRPAKNTGSNGKKRRRIIVEDESDSDIFGSDKSDDEELVSKSDEESEPVKPVQLPPRNKRRKPVEKIYEDDEGFIVTQTEYIYETASEDENEPERKPIKVEEKLKLEKKNSSNSEADVSPTKKGKKGKKGTVKKGMSGNQTSLKNFFKPK